MTRPLDDLLELLTDECPLCGNPPTGIEIRGPDEIVLGGWGHVADAKEWLEADALQDSLESRDNDA